MTLPSGWTVIKEDYLSTNPLDFLTHLNYVKFMRLLSNKISLEIKPRLKKRFPKKDSRIDKKATLIKLILQNLEQEYTSIKKEPDFAQVCTSWISVKSYYLLFNLTMILRYLMTFDGNSFNCSHIKLLNEFTGHLQRGEVLFSEPKLNKVCTGEDALSEKIRPGANIKSRSFDPEERCNQLFKKIEQYKEENFRREKKIVNLRKKVDRQAVYGFRQKTRICLFQFFYWYRIKANYRDLEFLNRKISEENFYEYYSECYNLTKNFYKAFQNLIDEISTIRFGKNILNATQVS
jgi:hypothetical protein